MRILLLLLISFTSQGQYLARLIGPASGGDTVWATLNAADKSVNVTLPTDLSWSVTGSGSGATGICRATQGKSSGKWYWETTIVLGTDNGAKVGISKSTDGTAGAMGSQGAGTASYGYRGAVACIMGPNGALNGTGLCTGQGPVTGSVVSHLLDMDNHTYTAWFNGATTATTISSLTGTYFPSVGGSGTTMSGTVNFGATPFIYSPPAGYTGVYIIVP